MENLESIRIDKNQFIQLSKLSHGWIGCVSANFETKQAILSLNSSGQNYVKNKVDHYNRERPILEANFELVVDFNSYEDVVTHIAKKQVGHEKLKAFCIEIVDRHQIVKKPDDSGNPVFEKVSKQDFIYDLEYKTETLKVSRYFRDLTCNTKASRPRLKILDKSLIDKKTVFDLRQVSVYEMFKNWKDRSITEMTHIESFSCGHTYGVELIEAYLGRELTFNEFDFLLGLKFPFEKNSRRFKELSNLNVLTQIGTV